MNFIVPENTLGVTSFSLQAPEPFSLVTLNKQMLLPLFVIINAELQL